MNKENNYEVTASLGSISDNTSWNESLLATRLSPPIFRSQIVHRARLTEQLWAGMHCKLTLVVAPAGYGKTTLLGEWLALTHKMSWPTAWVSLDRGSNIPLDFWTYLAQALGQIIPELNYKTFTQWGAENDAFDRQLAPIINQIATSTHHFCLILDDFHEIDNDSIHRHLAYLISCMPNNMHIIIASREIPPISLSRLRVSNQLVEIKAEDLLFNFAESEAFLCRVMNLRIAAEDVARLIRKTEGWVAGMQIAALSMKGRRDPAQFISAFDGNHHEMLDYLTEEILNQQSAPIKEFLLKTSILAALSAPLCDYVMGIDDSHEKLDYMERANLFTIALDDQRRWYRYHALFSDLLESQLQQTHPELVPELHIRTSEWLAQNGFPESAVPHAIAGGDLELAARIVEDCVAQADYQIVYGDLSPLIKLLPEAMIQERPKLAIFEVRANIFLGRIDLAAQKVNTLPDLIKNYTSGPMSDVERALLLREAAALQAAFDCLGSNYEQAITAASQLLNTFPTEDQYGGMLNHMLAYSYYCAGNLDEAADAFNRGAQMSAKRSCHKPIVLSLSERARIRQRQGRLGQAAQEYRQMLAIARDAGMDAYFTILPQAGLGDLYREWNDLDTAEQWMAPVFEYFDRVESRDLIWIYPVVVGSRLGRFLLTQGDIEAAAYFCDKAKQSLEVYQLHAPLKSELVDLQTRLWLAQGDMRSAQQWAREKWALYEQTPKQLTTAEQAALMRIYRADGRPEQALKLADSLEAYCRETSRGARLIETLMLKALALHARGDSPNAVEAMKQAVILAEPEGWVRLFVDEGEAIQPLLAALHMETQPRSERRGAAQQVNSRYIQKLLAALSHSRMTPAAKTDESAAEPTILSPLAEPLSQRELEVLALLRESLSVSEIAARLFIAKSTTKVHVRNIYQKLNVSSRKDAIERAVEWNLLN